MHPTLGHPAGGPTERGGGHLGSRAWGEGSGSGELHTGPWGSSGRWWGSVLQLRTAGEAAATDGDPDTAQPGRILKGGFRPGGPGSRGARARESGTEGSRARTSGVRGLRPQRVAGARLRNQPRQVIHQVPLLLHLLGRKRGASGRFTSGASSHQLPREKRPPRSSSPEAPPH